MVDHYLRIAVRHLLKHPGYALLNVGGLAVGIACCLLILFYIQHERNYDRFHEHADRIYRLADEQRIGDRVIRTAGTPAPWGSALKRDYPEVEQVVRMRGTVSAWLIRYKDKHFYERNLFWVDETLFEVFSFPLIQGDPGTALNAPHSMVISETMAKKYFGDEDPMGKVINADQAWDFTITGIMRDMPSSSHFHADMVASFSSLSAINGDPFVNDWLDHNNFYTYLLLRDPAAADQLERKLPGFIERYAGEAVQAAGMRFAPFLQPLTSIHLESHLNEELEPNSDGVYIYIFAAIALLIVLIACINYMNLATARGATRAKEIGMRKVVGASRAQLVRQFLGETVIMTVVAVILAVVLAIAGRPLLYTLSGAEVRIDWSVWWIWGSLAGLTILVGLMAGSYPALFLSALRPGAVLKGLQRIGASSGRLRQGLVVCQFVMSIGLLCAFGIVYSQIDYIRNKRLGFQKEHVVVMPAPNYVARQGYPPFKQKAVQNAGVIAVTSSTALPGTRLIPLEGVRPEGVAPGEQVIVPVLAVDYAFLETMGMELVAGRDFSPDFPSDMQSAFLLNETAVRRFGWSSPEEALGKSFEWTPFGGKRGEVIGVVRDFHLKSLHEPIEPAVLHLSPYLRYILVRVRAEDLPGALAGLKDAWLSVKPDFPFEYGFLDEQFDQLHRSDERIGRIVGMFSGLAIVVACLGLFGLAAFMTQQRTKEIGICKVLGASMPQIVLTLSSEFIRLVLIAGILALPLAYLVMTRWLQAFAYHTEITAGPFALAVLATVVIAWATVSVQALRAAATNPVEALRYE